MSDNGANEKKPKVGRPSFETLIVRTPLYQRFNVGSSGTARDWLEDLVSDRYTVDAHCPWCGKDHTPFKNDPDFAQHLPRNAAALGALFASQSRPMAGDSVFADRPITLMLTCQRDPSHGIICHFILQNYEFQKVGQHPSFADLHTSGMEQYRPAFDDYEKYRELKSAIICSANGYHVAAFTYLRRVFTHLLEQAHSDAREDSAWDEDAYQAAQTVPERIRLLASHLPRFLVEQRELYHILSEGIHSFSEDRCAGYFDLVKKGIEWILQDRLKQKEEARLRKETADAIRRARSEIHGQAEEGN